MTPEDIKKVLSEKRIKVSEAEKAMGMPQTVLSKILSGKRDIPYRYRAIIKMFIEEEGVEINLPTGETTVTSDPILISFFHKIKSGILTVSDSRKVDHTTNRYIVTPEIDKKIWDSIAPKMAEKFRKMEHLQKTIHYNKTGEIPQG